MSALQHGDAGAGVHSRARRRGVAVSASAVPSNRQRSEGSFFQNSNLPLTKLTDLMCYWSVQMKNAEAQFQVNHILAFLMSNDNVLHVVIA